LRHEAADPECSLPAEIAAQVNRAINAALAAEDMKLALSKLGSDGGSTQDFVALLRRKARAGSKS